jgi:trimethylamine-N-oxide reductase cytochrome c-type subunit TorC
MQTNRWLLVVLLVVGIFVGAGGIIFSVAVNRYTSTDAFCTSCHTMALQAADPYFQHSAHRSNNEGVRPSCGDCHIPKNNWFIETYTHVTSGAKDAFVESTHDFSDPKTWEARRVALALEVHAEMRAQDSVTCRSCHKPSAIHPTSESGRSSHALLLKGGVTCVDCHTNIVHPPAQPTAQTPASPPK